MYLFYLIFFDNKTSYRYFAIFGFLCGFAIWFHYINLVMIALCVLFWFVFDKIFFLRKKFFLFLIFFLVGFSPFIYYGATHGFRNLDMFRQGMTDQGFNLERIAQASQKFETITVHGIVDSLYFPDFFFVNGRLISHFYYIMFLISLGFFLWRSRKTIVLMSLSFIPLKKFAVKPKKVNREVFVLLYVILYILIYSYSRYEYCCPYHVDILEWPPVHKYKLMLYPFVFMSIAIFLAELYNGKKRGFRILSILIVLLILTTGFYANLNLISINSSNEIRTTAYSPYCYGGYEYRFWGESWNWEQSCSDLGFKYKECSNLDKEIATMLLLGF